MDRQEHEMTANEWQLFNHQKKIDRFWETTRYYCKCGHSVNILPKNKRTFCTYCGHWVFKDKREEFKYRLKEKMRNAL